MNKRMAILTSYFEGETHGMLGPQMAATIISENAAYDCIVICVTREDDKTLIKKSLSDFFGNERPVIGFSTLSGREDLFSFAKEFKDDGAVTILAGPQAHADFLGEIDWENHSHRFRGLSEYFTHSIHGPAEEAIPFLLGLGKNDWAKSPGLLFKDKNGQKILNREKDWEEKYLDSVKWNNLYRADNGGLVPIDISMAQVLQQIGCPHASRGRWVELDYPSSIKDWERNKVNLYLKGCSFCDVAIDKGFIGELDIETVLGQIKSLPAGDDGRKIPFELINENPLFRLPKLLLETKSRGIRLSQINLILRADYLLKGEAMLRESLKIAGDLGLRIMASSIGLEAFDDRLLKNFNKGLNLETNLNAIRLMRRLKEDFPDEWSYSKSDGAIHGFIHPTPWDTRETFANTQKNIAIYGLDRDILPPNSTPLIIHHASMLGDWIREVEKREGIYYKRFGSIIGWWHQE